MLSFIKRADQGSDGQGDCCAGVSAHLRAGSLSAARALGMSRPMVSRYLEQMESWAGARLIHRSTRRLTLTPAGEKVLLKTRGLTRIADEIAGERQRADPSGTLRVACAHFTAMQLISPLLPDFLARYPLLRLGAGYQ